MLTRLVAVLCICLFIFGGVFYFNPFDNETDQGGEMKVMTTTTIDVSNASEDLSNDTDVKIDETGIEPVSEKNAEDSNVLKGIGVKVGKDNKIGQTINNTAQEILKQRQEFERLVNEAK